MPVIEALKLSKSYGGNRGVRDLSFAIEHGEIFGYLGPNGSGKTTTIRLMLNFIRASSGEVRLFGKPVTKSGKELRQRIGYLPGEIGLPEGRTGESFLRFCAALSGKKAPLAGWLCDVLDFSISDRRRKIKTYSKGMKQKLAIIQALQHDPEVVILDEPTTGLDPLMQASLFEALRELRNRGKTIFFSSHVLSEVNALCDRIAVLREGHLVLSSTTQEFVARASRLLWIRPAEEIPAMDAIPPVADAIFLRREGDWLVYQVSPASINKVFGELERIRPADFRFESAIEDSFLDVYRRNKLEPRGVRR